MARHQEIYVALATMTLVAAIVARGDGHGTPIHVEAVAGQLVVSQGLSDPDGFAPMVFVEDDDDGEPLGNLSIPPFGSVIVWQIPGFDLFGLDNASSLTLEVMIRPVADSATSEQRTLWYWNDDTELVEPAPAASALYLLALDDRSATLLPTDTAAPPPLLLADSLTGQQGFHNHGLLAYALDNSPSPPSGAYGFFARLTSDIYAPSDPFLVVLNRSVENEQMIPAALAINAAAVDVEPIVGDYDGDGNVDTDDYNFWRARFGSLVTPLMLPDGNGNGVVDAADYVVWRNAVGAAGMGGIGHTVSVAEPSTVTLVCIMLTLAGSRNSGSARLPRQRSAWLAG